MRMTGKRQKKRLERLEKRSVGRPATGLNEMIAIRWEPWLIDGIERYGKKNMLTRPQALRHIVVVHLAQMGMVDPRKMYKEKEA